MKRLRCGGHVTRTRVEKFVNISVGKPEGKRPLGRPRSRWEIGLEDVD
jgi:hypothetical protein